MLAEWKVVMLVAKSVWYLGGMKVDRLAWPWAGRRDKMTGGRLAATKVLEMAQSMDERSDALLVVRSVCLLAEKTAYWMAEWKDVLMGNWMGSQWVS